MNVHFAEHPNRKRAKIIATVGADIYVSTYGIVWRVPTTGRMAPLRVQDELEAAWIAYELEREGSTP